MSSIKEIYKMTDTISTEQEEIPKSTPRKRLQVLPLEVFMEFCKALTGNRRNDALLGASYGLTKQQTDIIRSILGKVEYVATDVPDETISDIVTAYNDGKSMREISKKYGVSSNTIYSILKREGYEPKRKTPWSKIQEMRLIYLRDEKKYPWSKLCGLVGKSKDACISKYMTMKVKNGTK